MIWLCVLSLASGPNPTKVGTPPIVDLDVPVRSLSVEEAVEALLRPDLRPPFRAATPGELDALRSAVVQVSRAAQRGGVPAEALRAAADAGLVLEQWRVQGRTHLALVEPPEARHGMGAYVFSTDRSANTELLLQAPHPYHDQRTGEIAAVWHFEVGSSFAFFTSTLHRYTRSDGTRKKTDDAPADPCHTPGHPFDAATQAIVRARPATTIIQLHGFASDLTGDGRPPVGTVVVLSGGRPEEPTRLALAADRTLGAVLGPNVRVFPTEVAVLGGTTNVQAVGLASVPGTRFLHVELSDTLRPKLIEDRDLSRAVVSALVDSVRTTTR